MGEQNIASKLSNGRTIIFDDFMGHAELLNMATLILRDVILTRNVREFLPGCHSLK